MVYVGNRAFLPGRVVWLARRASISDIQLQVHGWWTANHRQHRVLGVPASMIASPPIPQRCWHCRRLGPAYVMAERSHAGWARDRLPVRLDSNDYSVASGAAIGRRIEIIADLNRVRVWCDGTLVADHVPGSGPCYIKRWCRSRTCPGRETAVRRKRLEQLLVVPHHVEVEQRRLADVRRLDSAP